MWHVDRQHTGGENATAHVEYHSDAGLGTGYSLHVTHDPTRGGGAYHDVSLWSPNGEGSGFRHHTLYWHRGTPAATVREEVGFERARSQPVQPPSAHLQQLIAQHHLHPDQWPVLLDAIQEEYPQLHEAIEAHHAARRARSESDAAQYARAVAAALNAR